MESAIHSRQVLLHTKHKPAPQIIGHNPIRHAPSHCLDKRRATAMHGDDDIRVQRGERIHRVPDVFGRRHPQVKAADHRMQLVDVRHLHRGLHGIDDADMAAGGNHHEAPTFDDIAGALLVGVFVLNVCTLCGTLHKREKNGQGTKKEDKA